MILNLSMAVQFVQMAKEVQTRAKIIVPNTCSTMTANCRLGALLKIHSCNTN